MLPTCGPAGRVDGRRAGDRARVTGPVADTAQRASTVTVRAKKCFEVDNCGVLF